MKMNVRARHNEQELSRVLSGIRWRAAEEDCRHTNSRIEWKRSENQSRYFLWSIQQQGRQGPTTHVVTSCREQEYMSGGGWEWRQWQRQLEDEENNVEISSSSNPPLGRLRVQNVYDGGWEHLHCPQLNLFVSERLSRFRTTVCQLQILAERQQLLPFERCLGPECWFFFFAKKNISRVNTSRTTNRCLRKSFASLSVIEFSNGKIKP